MRTVDSFAARFLRHEDPSRGWKKDLLRIVAKDEVLLLSVLFSVFQHFLDWLILFYKLTH